MKTIGLLGGMSWESTLEYYRRINQGIKQTLGGLHSARIVMVSVDFAPIEKKMVAGDWDGVTADLEHAAGQVAAAGADALLICTNTMHKLAPAIEASVSIPLIHIADATAAKVKEMDMGAVGLLGTAVTMTETFYRGRLIDQHGLQVLTPDSEDRQLVNDIIFKELCQGRILPESRTEYLRIIASLAEQGAGAVILGCTEIGMLVGESDTGVPLLDTTAIHADAAVAFALSGEKAS